MSIDLDKIKHFAAAWYLSLDNHAPSEELAALLTDDVQMVFPEATLPGINDFKAWYAGGRYSNGTDAPGVINIFFDESPAFRLLPDAASQHVVPVAWFGSPTPLRSGWAWGQ